MNARAATQNQSAPAGSASAGHLTDRSFQTLPNQSTAPSRNGSVTRQNCLICGKAILDEHWFCRLPCGDERVVLCSPACAMRYFDALPKKNDQAVDDSSGQQQRLHFVVNGELA